MMLLMLANFAVGFGAAMIACALGYSRMQRGCAHCGDKSNGVRIVECDGDALEAEVERVLLQQGAWIRLRSGHRMCPKCIRQVWMCSHFAYALARPDSTTGLGIRAVWALKRSENTSVISIEPVREAVLALEQQLDESNVT